VSSLPKKLPYYLLELSYGASAGTSARFTTRAAAVTYEGDTYAALPKLAVVELPANTGVLEEGTLKLEVPVDAHALFAALVSGEKHSPVYATLRQVNEPLQDDGGADEVLVLCLMWRVGKATKNPTKKRGVVRLEATGPKAHLADALGMPALYQCAWQLFDQGCGLETLSDNTGTLTAIDGTDNKKVTITGVSVTVPGATPGKTFHRGYVERDGMRLEIRDWSSGASTTFHLERKPPAAWVGQTVTVVAGCDKAIETCRGRFANEERFQGCGYAMPDRQPNFETGNG
jgi:hypothetical protein